jgi:cell division protease FtsH
MDCSSELARQIDEEIRLLIAQASAAARRVLEDHRGQLDTASEILLRRETIEREQFVELLEGKTEDQVFVDAPPSGRHPPRPPSRQRQSGARGAARSERPPAPARAPA